MLFRSQASEIVHFFCDICACSRLFDKASATNSLKLSLAFSLVMPSTRVPVILYVLPEATGSPALIFVHGTVGLQHAAMGLYNAWCDRAPILTILGNQTNAVNRRPNIDWVHAAQDPASIVRDMLVISTSGGKNLPTR